MDWNETLVNTEDNIEVDARQTVSPLISGASLLLQELNVNPKESPPSVNAAATKNDVTFAQRAAFRLNALLTHLGFGQDPKGRANTLAETLGVTSQTAQQLLSGTELWQWELLRAVCTCFEKEPGFFLDELHAKVPLDSVVVHSSCGGDPIAFRASEWFIGRKLKADTRLKYLIEHSDSSRFRKGSLLIYAEVDCQAGDIFPGDACVITDGDSLEVVACQSTTDTHASFAPISGNGATMTVPFNARYVHTRPGAPYMIDDGERLQLMRCKGANDTMASFEPFSGKGVARMIPLDTSRVASPTRMVGIVIATFCAELSPRLADREQDGHGLRPL